MYFMWALQLSSRISAVLVGAAISLGLQGHVLAEDDSERHPPLEELHLVHDGKGHYLAMRPMQWKPTPKDRMNIVEGTLFYGNGKALHYVHSRSYGVKQTRPVRSLGDPYVVEFDDFRFGDRRGRGITQKIERIGDRWTLRCGKAIRQFVEVDTKTAKRIASRAKRIDESAFPRTSYLLARDDGGKYYYVDTSSKSDAAPYDKHVYVGRRGGMRRLKLRDVVVDAAGELFVGKTGTLKYRSKAGRGEVTWISPKGARTPLTLVPIGPGSRVFIHTDLGVYLGKKRGTPCDWL